MWKRLLAVLLLLSVCSCLHVAAQETCEQDIQSSYLSIRDKLIHLKANSEHVTKQLQMLSEKLEVSQQEAASWKRTSTSLSENLKSINEQLADCYSTIMLQQAQLRVHRKTVVILLSILIIRTLLMLAGFALYLKGIRLPRWVDIFL